MKFRALFTFVTSTIFTLTSATLTSVQAADAEKERWFEIEVILFSQLNDKSKLKEQFPDSKQLPDLSKKYPKVRNLLQNYLYPETQPLKALLPVCGQAPELNWQQQALNYQYFPIKSLAEIAAQASVITPTINSDSTLELSARTNLKTGQLLSELNDSSANSLTTQMEPYAGQQYGLTRQQVNELLTQAEQTLSPYQFTYITEVEPDFCALSAQSQAFLAEHIEGYGADYYVIEQMPKQINSPEFVDSKQPYLIAKDSLQLTDIYKELKRSREFRPLLHLGWRQAAVAKAKAIPVRLFAGDNFNAYYQQELALFKAKQAEAERIAEQQELPSELQALANTTANESKPARTNSLVSQLNHLWQQLEHTPQDKAELMAALAQPSSSPTTIATKPEQAPKPPPQQWYIDGFFKVHLNHYLFITADFNILNKTLAEQITASLANSYQQAPNTLVSHEAKLDGDIKTIRFEQNRRVISKQIHYFDHPYMGMIVQIRRYQKPEPELETELEPEQTDNSNQQG